MNDAVEETELNVDLPVASKKTIKDPLSAGVAHPLLMYLEGETIATGTGFFYKLNDKLYFITAGHNITGKNPETSEVMGC